MGRKTAFLKAKIGCSPHRSTPNRWLCLICEGYSCRLAFDEDTPGVGMVFWMNFSPEGTLLITDGAIAQALEFSRTDGQYIRSFGRRGNGPGEYSSAAAMAVDP